MSDILVQDFAYQSSSAPTIAYDQYAEDLAFQSTSQACISDITPPSFSGIDTLIVGSRGQIVASWLAATDPTPPIRYEIYIKAVTSTGLFVSNNIIAITDKLQFSTFTMPDGSFLQNGIMYYVGVRAIDGVNNRDGNSVVLNVLSTGVFVSAEEYKVEGTFAVGTNNSFQGTMWILKNSVLGLGATLGTASYQVYDKLGNAVSGMNESGIIADANGQFKITPITSNLLQALEHYVVKVSIIMDSATRTGYVPLVEPIPTYEVVASYNISDNSSFKASIWVLENGNIITDPTRLGVANYDVYDEDGVIVIGFGESGITPNAAGLYQITPIPNLTPSDIKGVKGYVTVVVDGIARSNYIPTLPETEVLETKGQFSINALNQFQATFWIVVNGNVYPLDVTLGTASYQVYDYAGVAVAGLSESGLVADVNGFFHSTPVSASLLTDLTHYTVTIDIIVGGIVRKSAKGFTLLGT